MSGEVPDFDLAMLRELAQACSKRAFVDEFARGSLRDAAIALDRLAAAAERGHWDEVHERAHAIKGIAANVGAVRVAAGADLVMRRTEAAPPPAWRDEVQQLRAAMQAALAGLDAVLSSLDEWAPHG